MFYEKFSQKKIKKTEQNFLIKKVLKMFSLKRKDFHRKKLKKIYIINNYIVYNSWKLVYNIVMTKRFVAQVFSKEGDFY